MNTLSNKVVDTQEVVEALRGVYPRAYLYQFSDPMSGKPVWRTNSGPWNGQTPKATEALYSVEQIAAIRSTQCSGDTQELADPQVVVAGKLLTIKPGAPEIALLCRAIFRASFADDEDEALVNQKYQEWEEDQAKAIRAARFVLRALGGNGSVVRALRTTHSLSSAEVEAVAAAIKNVTGGVNYDYMDFCRDAARAAIAALSLPSDKTVELLREAREDLRGLCVIADQFCDDAGLCLDAMPHILDARETLAKIDSHLGEMK